MSERRSHAWETRTHDGAEFVAELVALHAQQVVVWEKVAQLDRNGTWAVDGARSLASWVATFGEMGMGEASRLVGLARAARHVPAIAAAMASGELSEAKARVLLEACTDARAEYVERDLDLLIDQAATLRMVDTRTVVKHWAARVDAEIEAAARVTQPDLPVPVGALEAAKDAAFRMRRLDLGSPCLDTVVFDGVMDAEDASVMHTAIEAWLRMEQPDVEVRMTDQRSAGQKRLDATIGIFGYFLRTAASPVIGGERPTVNVIVDLHTLTGSHGGVAVTDRGATLTTEQVRRICCDAKVNRVVMAGPSAVLDLGRGTRTPSLHLRKAVATRDRHCRFPGCTMPGRYCDAHHIIHWADDGPTNPANLMLLCGHHHRVIHDAHWSVAGDANGELEFTRPDGTRWTEPALRRWRPPPDHGEEPAA